MEVAVVEVMLTLGLSGAGTEGYGYVDSHTSPYIKYNITMCNDCLTQCEVLDYSDTATEEVL